MKIAENILPTIIGDFVSAIMGAVALPPMGGCAALGVQALFANRQRQALLVLQEELRKGDLSLAEIDEMEVAAIAYRFHRAAIEGTARSNLRLLARLITGMAAQRVLSASRFLYYSDLLASLRQEEIIALASLHKHTCSTRAEGRSTSPIKDVAGELVPNIFPTAQHLDAVMAALLRTGLVRGNIGFGAMLFEASPLLEELIALAPLEDLGVDDDPEAWTLGEDDSTAI